MPQDKHNEKDHMGESCGSGSKGKEEKGHSMKNIREPEGKYEKDRAGVAQKEKPRAKEQDEQDEDEGQYCNP